jgi:hypothetical protein
MAAVDPVRGRSGRGAGAAANGLVWREPEPPAGSPAAAGSGENGGLIEIELTRPGRKPGEALEIGQLVFREADA